jgi:hypothetical protein
MVRYLSNSYKGVGKKTAERLVQEYGSGLFEKLHREPKEVEAVIPAGRFEQLLKGWKADLARRLERTSPDTSPQAEEKEESRPASRRRTRRGGRGRGKEGEPEEG